MKVSCCPQVFDVLLRASAVWKPTCKVQPQICFPQWLNQLDYRLAAINTQNNDILLDSTRSSITLKQSCLFTLSPGCLGRAVIFVRSFVWRIVVAKVWRFAQGVTKTELCDKRSNKSGGGGVGGGVALQGRRSVINFAWVSLPSCVCLVLFGRNNSSGRKWIPGMNDEAAVKNDPHFQCFQEVTASSYRKITFRMFDQLHAWHLWVSALHFRGFQQ